MVERSEPQEVNPSVVIQVMKSVLAAKRVALRNVLRELEALRLEESIDSVGNSIVRRKK